MNTAAASELALPELQASLRDLLERRPVIALDQGGNGLAQLLLTLIKLIHDLLEKQALRRLDDGTLNEAEAERIGQVLMAQAREIRALCRHFHIDPRDLHLDLGPLGKI
jgi:hypothetical protein